MFLKREVYEKYGEFNLEFKSAADYELMLRFLYKEGVETIYLPKITIKMREGGLSNQSLKHRIRANKEDRKAWKINGLKCLLLLPILKPMRKIPPILSKNLDIFASMEKPHASTLLAITD